MGLDPDDDEKALSEKHMISDETKAARNNIDVTTEVV
jgi:hypothetical protein